MRPVIKINERRAFSISLDKELRQLIISLNKCYNNPQYIAIINKFIKFHKRMPENKIHKRAIPAVGSEIIIYLSSSSTLTKT